MKVASKILRLAGALLATSAAAMAQSQGYLLFGPGGVTSYGNTSGAMYMGGGGEVISRIGLGGGGEIGYTTPWRSFTSGIGIASVNAAYHFRQRQRVVPFVTGGYTLFFRSGYANGYNFGGGVNWWFANHVGLKVELRDHVGTGDLSHSHWWAVRAGITFR